MHKGTHILVFCILVHSLALTGIKSSIITISPFLKASLYHSLYHFLNMLLPFMEFYGSLFQIPTLHYKPEHLYVLPWHSAYAGWLGMCQVLLSLLQAQTSYRSIVSHLYLLIQIHPCMHKYFLLWQEWWSEWVRRSGHVRNIFTLSHASHYWNGTTTKSAYHFLSSNTQHRKPNLLSLSDIASTCTSNWQLNVGFAFCAFDSLFGFHENSDPLRYVALTRHINSLIHDSSELRSLQRGLLVYCLE